MSEKPATSDATIQMTPEDVKRLHRQLAGQAVAEPEPAPAPEPEPAAMPEADPADIPTARARARDLASRPVERPAPEPEPKREPAIAPAPLTTAPLSPARQPRPAPPAPVAEGHASVPVIVGAIGIFLALAGLVLMFLPHLQGMGRETEGPGFLAFSVAHIFVAVGFFAAATRTSGVAILVGIFSLLVALSFGAAFLMDARILKSIELVKPVLAAVLVMPGLTWLLAGIWGFVGLKPQAPGLGIPVGLFGMLGGLAGVTGAVMLLAGIPEGMHSDDDLMVMLTMISNGGIALAMLFTAIGFIAKVSRAPRIG